MREKEVGRKREREREKEWNVNIDKRIDGISLGRLFCYPICFRRFIVSNY